ncbi:hypothetical protein H5410_019425 [Solanum commersonii]|uniref:Uncharacterized protein n=1 Tax=Solanum commersonii TaxID=4109 RepID=A0A9J5Z899_SOLCO|nr:hypothetical protein H5410_019425 [Solanum commersonii]
MPKSAGGLNILNLTIWNSASICKLLWASSQKKKREALDHLGPYVQHKEPELAAWMIKKILQMWKHWQKLGDMRSLIVKGKFHLATAYKCLWGEMPKDGRNGKEESKNEAQNGIGNNNTPEMCPQVHLLLLVSSYKLPLAQSASKPVVSTVPAKQLQLLTPNSQTKLMTSSDDQPLWKKVIREKYGLDGIWTTKFLEIIRNLWPKLLTKTMFSVGNGRKVDLWNDKWIEQGSLKQLYPDIYSLNQQQNSTIEMVWDEQGWNLSFRRALTDWEIDRLASFFGALEQFKRNIN